MAKGDAKKEWKEFLWNPRTREFLGRTASSWGLILLFYLAFYVFLGGLFAFTMYAMMMTLDDDTPTYQDRLSTPGMMIRPKGDELEIMYKVENTETWDTYVQALDGFLSSYNDSEQIKKNYECTADKYYIQTEGSSAKQYPKRSCQFKRSVLGDCSGIGDRFYGYNVGQPCIIVKLNRVVGLLPGKDGQTPFISCGPKKYKLNKDDWGDDGDKIGELAYFPPNGTLNLMYFPYYGKKAQVNYAQPVVAVKFLNITNNVDVSVECKIVANNIPAGSERDKFCGKVSFKLRVDSRN